MEKAVQNAINALYEIRNNELWTEQGQILTSPKDGWTREIFGMEAIKHMLVEPRIPEECFRVIKDGVPQPHRFYSRPLVVGSKAIGRVMDGAKASVALSEGSSLLLTAVEEFYPSMGRFCAKLGDSIGTKCSAFAVVTPPNQGGFVPHIDRTEQLVIQCEGSKRWKVYDIYDQQNSGGEVDVDKIGIPSIYEDVNVGDMIYLPQGAPHSAEATDTLSCHITITFEPVTIGNWVQKAMLKSIQDDAELSKSLPPFYYTDDECEEHLQKVKDKVREIYSNVEEKSEKYAKETINKQKAKGNQ
ncbi:hypothetical protein HNR44_001707 [Geomicrobium halophilum]|uniref:JmjC domain-containing protein n=1 Tax=Geomicrobium halophilum TaxID=549000 RepID=A0A841PLV2_9BACL|nr:cupin domain-containing protein [Geomicrobium halophilum]MBB6449729.1 hypothetical protein [Geomicrobium halophilum]